MAGRVVRSPAGTWTPDRVVQALRDWTQLVGSPPRSYEWAPASARVLGREGPMSRLWAVRHPRWPSTATVVRHFGGWNRALSAAGLPMRRPPVAPASGRAKRIELAQRLAASMSTSEIATVLDVSARTVRAYLGAGRCADCGTYVVTAAERCPRCAARLARPPERSREAVLEAIRKWTRETGRPPTQADWPRSENERWPSYMTVTTHFGTWRRALEAAGFRANRRLWSRVEIIEALQRFAAENGRPPRQEDLVYAAGGMPTMKTIRSRFGSYAEALAQAGVNGGRRPR